MSYTMVGVSHMAPVRGTTYIPCTDIGRVMSSKAVHGNG